MQTYPNHAKILVLLQVLLLRSLFRQSPGEVQLQAVVAKWHLHIYQSGSKSLTTEHLRPCSAFIALRTPNFTQQCFQHLSRKERRVKIIGLWGLSRVNFADLNHLAAASRHLQPCFQYARAKRNEVYARTESFVFCAICSLHNHKACFNDISKHFFKESLMQSRCLCVTKTGKILLDRSS